MPVALPLLVSAGAGAASRQAVGNAVVGGMIAATAFSLMFVPAFFVVFQLLSEMSAANRAKAKIESSGKAVEQQTATSEA